MPLVLLGAALHGVLLGGCLHVEESFTFARDSREGGGTYALSVRWNADLLQRVRDVVGPAVLERFQGRPFPLRLEEWRESLRALDHVDLKALEETVEPGGWRTLRTVVGFGRLEHLMAWEPLAGRSLSVEGPEGDRPARLRMAPFARLPLIDRLRAAADARAAPDPVERAPRDLPPLERLGVEPGQAALLERLLTPALADLRLLSRITVAGRVRGASANAQRAEGSEAAFLWRWADLVAGSTRALEVTWTPGEFDAVPLWEQAGEAPGR